ncbi:MULTISPECIES: thioredoxin family protein [Petrotoga]|uniref:Glutaredoxin-like protein n=2 Tax=Petrotoga sibirica TaxID=156202 RepID=A0A4R8EGS5_9BACT|nr:MULTISPECIES: thioredoxin family protein [Petrotoga]POZ88488.1 glutaredoxin [Petrotoga sibirica DSM 13575]POZ91368.1 glutaredoxin [Petrotoga sp. SL27]TDX11084.1 glutaredoxin-like protein [Petrotoga sibirica]
MEKILDKETQNKVREILEKLTEPVQLLLFKNDGEYSEIVEQLLEELRELDDRIKVDTRHSDSQEINNYDIEKDLLPAMLILDNEGRDYRIRYYGIPSGYEFATFLQNIIAVSNKTVDSFNNENKEKLSQIDKNVRIRVFVTPTCPYCPRAVFAAHQTAMLNPNIIGEMIEANEFDSISFEYAVSSVPHTVIEVKENGTWVKKGEFVGAYPENSFVEEVLKAVE